MNNRTDKEVYKLESRGLIPENVRGVLRALERNRNDLDVAYLNQESIYTQTRENREDSFQRWQRKKEDFMEFKQEHHGIMGKIIYNIPPIRWFSAVGREYQCLKREVKLLKREYNFWLKYSDEAHNVFEATAEQSAEARKALIEYKKLIVKKSKNYKEEFKMIEEYNKLIEQFGDEKFIGNERLNEEIKNFIDPILTGGWFNNEKKQPNFNVRKATRLIEKIRKGERLNDKDKLVMSEIINKKPKTKKTINVPKGVFTSSAFIDREAIDKILTNNKEMEGFSPEKYMAFLGNIINAKELVNIEDVKKEIENIKDNDELNKLARQGLKHLESYIISTYENNPEDKKKKVPNYEYIDKVVQNYTQAKEKIEQDRQATQQQQQGQQQGD